ncbi:MAG: ABC transporter permease [Chloroflexi bacterium]|nr:ABC transporter permease [Chloroflexota bacterium]
MSLGYLLGRVGTLLVIIWLAVSINFVLPRLTPGDPIEERFTQMAQSSGGQGDITAMVEAYREKFGLDQPLWKQYLNYWGALFRLDLGYSLQYFPERVSSRIISALPWTIGLLGASVVISFVIGSLLGSFMAWRSSSRPLRFIVPVAMVLSAIPYYLLGIVLIYLLAIRWRLLPPGGGFSFTGVLTFSFGTALDIVSHAILPALAIVLASMGSWALGMRGMMITVLGEDYITMATAKGLKERTVFLNYGIRTCMLPQFTHLALALGHIVSGAILVEVIFSYPGVGLKLFEAIRSKDYMVIQGIVLVLSVSLSAALFIMDLLYPLVDPRIAYRQK